ncbi:MAG: DUF1036 domain-containing protein, partial [Pseudomonadota bacterium]
MPKAQPTLFEGRTSRAARRWMNAWAFSISLVGLNLLALATTNPARADLRVCNDTQAMVGVAVGYRNKTGWISEGWWRIPAETCASVIEG